MRISSLHHVLGGRLVADEHHGEAEQLPVAGAETGGSAVPPPGRSGAQVSGTSGSSGFTGLNA